MILLLKRKLKYFKVLIIVFILTISFFGVIPFVFVSPDNITLYTTADAFFLENVPDGNWGDNIEITAYTRNDGRNRRSFLKFDLSGLPAGAVISLVKLRLYCNTLVSMSSPDTDVQACRVTDDSWIEDEITWTNQKAYGDVEDTKEPTVGWVEWTVTDFVKDEFAGDKTVSICLRCVTESYDLTARHFDYHSKEYNGDNPELYIEYTIEEEDDFPFYSDINDDGVTQVGESVQCYIKIYDDFDIDGYILCHNSSGIYVNYTYNLDGVFTYISVTSGFVLNYTQNVLVRYMWYMWDNVSQYNQTSYYSITITPLYITFNLNNSTMGKFNVNHINTANETQNSYDYNQSILLDGIPLNSSYLWNNFTWIDDSTTTNNYDYYTSGNNTVWCNFDLVKNGIGGIHEDYFVLGFVIAGCSILFVVIVLKSDKKEK